MNQLIEKFIAESTICQGHPQIDGSYFDKEKFAELIVCECATIANKWVDDIDNGQNYPSEIIKQHFGFDK